MNMRGLVVAGCVLAGTLGIVDRVSAQNGAPVPVGHWTVTPSVMVGTGGNLDSTGAGFGIAGGYEWDRHIAFEAAFNSIPSVDQGVLLTVNSSIWTATGNLLYYFTGQRDFSPYVAGGVGFGHGSADVPQELQTLNLNLTTSSTNFLADLGGGLSRRISDRLAVRGDLRYFIGSELVPNFWRAGVGLGIDIGRQ